MPSYAGRKLWGAEIRVSFDGSEEDAYRVGSMLEAGQDICTDRDRLTIVYPQRTDPKIVAWLQEQATGSKGVAKLESKDS